jgi:PPM family protein phosphatase
MNVEGDGVRLFLGDNEVAHSDDEFPSGMVSVRTLRSPDKTTANEDAAAVIPIGDQALVLAVADGVGGTPAGREASTAAVQTLRWMLAGRTPDPGGFRSAILDAVEEANRTVIALSRGAATTLVVGEVFSRQLRSYHVGDSELIAVGQRGRVKARVVPHSPTGFAVEAGLLDAEEAIQHDQRHVLFNVIGSPDMRVEIGTALRIADRDTVLLASDGLLDNLYLDEIIDAIRVGPLPDAADRLVRAARDRMAGLGNGELPCKPDDLTIILYRRHPPKRDKRMRSRQLLAQRPVDPPD